MGRVPDGGHAIKMVFFLISEASGFSATLFFYFHQQVISVACQKCPSWGRSTRCNGAKHVLETLFPFLSVGV